VVVAVIVDVGVLVAPSLSLSGSGSYAALCGGDAQDTAGFFSKL